MRLFERPMLIITVFVFWAHVFWLSMKLSSIEDSLVALRNNEASTCETPVVRERAVATSERPVTRTFPLLNADDPVLIAYVKEQLMQPPAMGDYNLLQPDKVHYSQYTQSQIASVLLDGLNNGFFLEAGALDGEDKSNTLFFEKERSWTGLLVEPDPSLYSTLMSKKRKAYAINAAFSLTNTSDVVHFVPHRGLGRLVPGSTKGIPVKTVPISTMLQALGVSQIDFFSLDIEGAEMKVLATFPWDKVKIRLMCIEINHIGIDRVSSFMEQRGYMYVGRRHIDAWYGLRELLAETMNLKEYPKELIFN